MMMRFQIVFSALALGWGVCVWAQTDDFISPLVDRFEAGILCAQETGVTRDAPDTVAGTTHVIEQAPPFVSDSRVVPAVLGIGFGARVSLLSETGLNGVIFAVQHPAFAGKGATEQSFETVIGGQGAPGLTFYQFDYPYELALGDWRMTATSGGITIYDVTFTVVPPTTVPELAAACGYADLFS